MGGREQSVAHHVNSANHWQMHSNLGEAKKKLERKDRERASQITRHSHDKEDQEILERFERQTQSVIYKAWGLQR
jgi:hypothetical protein